MLGNQANTGESVHLTIIRAWRAAIPSAVVGLPRTSNWLSATAQNSGRIPDPKPLFTRTLQNEFLERASSCPCGCLATGNWPSVVGIGGVPRSADYQLTVTRSRFSVRCLCSFASGLVGVADSAAGPLSHQDLVRGPCSGSMLNHALPSASVARAR